VEEAILEIYSLVSLGFVNNATVFISKVSTRYGCSAMVIAQVYRTARGTALFGFSVIEALKDVQPYFSKI
jgi:hypothetical protein